jgi:hypothetical protein
MRNILLVGILLLSAWGRVLPAQTTVDTLAAVRVVAPRVVKAKVISELTLGEFSGGARLYGVRDAALIGDSLIAILDWGLARAQLYNYDGVFKARIGTRGKEFGALLQPHRVLACGNGALTLLDIDSRAVNEYSRDGLLRFTVPVVVPPQSIICWPTGDAAGVFVRREADNTLTATVRPIDTLDVPRPPLLTTSAGESQILGATLQIGASALGVWYGTGATATLNFMLWADGSVRVDTVGVPGREATRMHQRDAIDVLVSEAPATFIEQQRLRRQLLGAPFRDTLPAYRNVVVDVVSGDAWVVTSPVGTRHMQVTILSPDGKSRGDLKLRGWELLSVRAGEALVVDDSPDGRGAMLVVHKLEGPAKVMK